MTRTGLNNNHCCLVSFEIVHTLKKDSTKEKIWCTKVTTYSVLTTQQLFYTEKLPGILWSVGIYIL